jgi:hypothetical protein
LRAVSVAVLMCCPVAQAFISDGLARFRCITKWKSCIWTLPAPPPPPGLPDVTIVSPQLQDSMSISSLCFASTLSPLMPSNFRK